MDEAYYAELSTGREYSVSPDPNRFSSPNPNPNLLARFGPKIKNITETFEEFVSKNNIYDIIITYKT